MLIINVLIANEICNSYTGEITGWNRILSAWELSCAELIKLSGRTSWGGYFDAVALDKIKTASYNPEK